MVIEDAGLGAMMGIGLAVAAGMSELEAEEKAGVGAGGLFVLRDEGGAELREAGAGVVGDYELIGIGAGGVRNGDGFAAPD